MAATCLISWIVLIRSAIRLVWVGSLVVFACGLCCGDVITGVVLSKTIGPTGDASGTVRLATTGKTHTVDYSAALEARLSAESCHDIGAVWRVDVRLLPDSSESARSIACDGESDKAAHGAWMVVREYLALADGHLKKASGLLSARWRASPEGRDYEARVERLDLRGYRLFGGRGTCIGVLDIQGPQLIRFIADADCHLTISGEPVTLVFTVRQVDKGGPWEIDRVEVH
jgi:hypothetical protein